ncbi:MAG: permease, partial [Planctomycetota bacterium]
LMPWSGTARNLPGEGGFLFLFVALFWIPTLAGSLLSALLAPGARHRTASRPGFAILSGLRLAFETPVCSCGALPVYEDLAGHGGSLRRGLSFLLAAPVLQLENLILAAVLLGPRFALLWLLADLLVAGGLAVFLSRKGTLLAGAARLDGFDSGHAPSEAGPRAGFLRARFAGFSDRIQHATAWLLAGLVLLLLASAAGLAPVSTAPGESPLLLVLLVSLLALPWTLDPKALLPLAWFLSGAPAGAILALLLIGPLTGRAARRTLARLHGARFSATLTALLFVTAAGLGWLLDPILALPKSPPAAEFLAFLEPLRSQTLFLSLFLLPALYALFRCGPRGLLAQVLPAREHEHAHHPGEPHEHTGAQRVQIDLAGEPPSSTREP